MKKPSIGRREFVQRCVAAGAGMIAGTTLSGALERASASTTYEVCSVVGDRYFDNTMKAVEALGGMGKFVLPGSRVGLLINSHFGTAGSYTNPDIALAIVRLCRDAGAKQIVTINEVGAKYWIRSKYAESMNSEIGAIGYSDATTDVTIDKGKALRNAEISTALLSCDVFINLPIIKDHDGTRFTCNLKNAMGACSRSTCRRFHHGDSSGMFDWLRNPMGSIELLAQSIADINLVRRPDLCIVDATEILATNGPGGPGEVRRPREIIGARNCLAADMYAIRHLGLDWEDLPILTRAREHGYGPNTLQEINVRVL